MKRHMAELRAASEERNARIAAVRERERRRRAAEGVGAFRGGKRARPSTTASEGGKAEEDFLPEDAEQPPDDGLNLSAEVRALMAQLEKPKGGSEEEVEEDVPKVS